MNGVNFFKRVYKVVRKVPKGKVTTYGEIAEIVNSSSLSSRKRITSRVVGWALHANRDPKVPCHRVVNKDGRLAPNFAFGGAEEQKRRLIAEDVSFRDETQVDLEKHIWKIKQ